jgi:hypothetical protein
VLPRRQAEPRAELPPVPEDLRIGYRGGQRTGGHRTDTEQFAGTSCNVTGSRVDGDLLVAAGEPQVQRDQFKIDVSGLRRPSPSLAGRAGRTR